ncbi:MAG TPA: RagB/SusD family nutrient uptake outer membrane protein [Puia sp.]|uniref:RagB/SusD family nutrient uptake outer membrane protein n=1 Tax=Puia sp. TaxID=2045100 RepID=UPI002D0D7D66|nr:RagB/SusD family nutrient uptake outer membrane protein [Puia sp.]HVU95477.1 RagB/SusD family nutrient uptake outer membrane protein [Puia sp.]
MMRNIHRQFFLKNLPIGLFSLGVVMTGCKKFVQIGPPTTQLVTVGVFNSSAAATSAQLAIYIKMFQESWNMAQCTGLMSDELKNYSTSPTLVQYYTNALLPINNPGPWKNAYSYIYQANAVISGLRQNKSIYAPIAVQLTSEAKFIRAFWHFYLTNLYGDVPLVLTTDYTVNRSMSRAPQAQVYRQIVSDLEDAYSGLNAEYVDASDTTVTTDRVRPTKSAAAAMLARVFLYTQKYDSAEIEANLVINNTSHYSLCTNLSAAAGDNYVFQANSTEAIWQLAPPLPANFFTYDGFDFYLKGAPTKGSTNSATISSQLLSSFEPNDQRKVQWVGTRSVGSAKYYFPYKYQSYNKSATDPSSVTEYTMMLRLAEQYLIRAEARIEEGNGSGAIADLNVIRERAGLPDYNGGSDKESLLAAILHERQIELFTEWGNRWLDLKRTGNSDGVMGGAGGACEAKGGSWSSTDQLLPVPQSEISNDASMTQNTGY